MSDWDAVIRGWLVRALPVAAATALAATAALTPSTVGATCMSVPSPQSIADAIHSQYGGLAFEGVVRQHWFATSLIEVERTWQGHTPSRFVAVGPGGGPEGGIRDLTVGRSYLFWVGAYPGPMYAMGCGAPFDADPKVIALLGPGDNPPGFGPVDLLVMAGFVWWSSSVLIAPLIAVVVIGALIGLSRKWSTD